MIQKQNLGACISNQQDVQLISVLWRRSRIGGRIIKWNKPVTQTNSRCRHAVGENCQANDDEPAGEPLSQDSCQINELSGNDRIQHGTNRGMETQILELLVTDASVENT